MKMEKTAADVNGGTNVDQVEVTATREPCRLWDTTLRILALGFTTVAFIIMSVAKETETVPVQLSLSLPALLVVVHAKSFYSSAFVYFVVVNIIACVYGILYLILSVIIKSRRAVAKTWASVLTVVADVIIVGLLFSGNGAAAAIGVVGERGNSHLRWNKVCGVFGRFCTTVKVSIAMSLVGCLVYLFVITLAIVNLHRRSFKASSGSV